MENKWKYKVTIFTPTYNRAYIIEKLYHSIQKQTFRDFEWLIVDDGSSDNTEEVFKEWIKTETSFPIRFYKQANGGKCRAINYGLDLAEGEMFFVMDSDDTLTPDALEKVVKWESTIRGKGKYSHVVGNRGTTATDTPNKIFPVESKDVTSFEMYPEYTDDILDGDRAEAWYTEVHRQFKYPEFEGENYMPPAVAWNMMAMAGYKGRLFNDIIWICNYLEDGLSAYGNKRVTENPKSHGLIMHQKMMFCKYNAMEKLRVSYSYYCDFREKLSITEISNNLGLNRCYTIISKIIFWIKRFKP